MLFKWIKSKSTNQPLISILNSNKVLISNCFQKEPLDVFVETDESIVLMGNNFFNLVKEPTRIKK